MIDRSLRPLSCRRGNRLSLSRGTRCRPRDAGSRSRRLMALPGFGPTTTCNCSAKMSCSTVRLRPLKYRHGHFRRLRFRRRRWRSKRSLVIWRWWGRSRRRDSPSSMRLSNETGAVAYLHAVNLLEPELRAAVIVKKTYVLAPDGTFTAATDPLPLVADQLVTDFGHFTARSFSQARRRHLCVRYGALRRARPADPPPYRGRCLESRAQRFWRPRLDSRSERRSHSEFPGRVSRDAAQLWLLFRRRRQA